MRFVVYGIGSVHALDYATVVGLGDVIANVVASVDAFDIVR